MSSLNEFGECLKRINSDRTSERKKQVDHLKVLLERKHILSELNSNHGKKKANSKLKILTWDTAFSHIRNFLVLEYEKCSRSTTDHQRLTQIRQNEIFSHASFFRQFVKKANEGGPKLNANIVTKHILEVLDNESFAAIISKPYTTVLLKDVLAYPACHPELPPASYEKLIQSYLDLIPRALANQLDSDVSLLSRAILVLVQSALTNFDLDSKPLLKFFTEVITAHVRDLGMDCLANVLQIFLLIGRNYGTSCRTQLCLAGERVLMSFVNLWSRSLLPDNVKELLLEFFRLQMALHHPQGGQTPEEGFLAYDPDSWRSHLAKLYRELISSFDNMFVKKKHVGRSCDRDNAAERQNLRHIDLVAVIYRQVYSGQSATVEPAAKKPKMESGFEVILNNIKGSIQLQAWLSLTSSLLRNFPDTFTSRQLLELLDALLQSCPNFISLEMKSLLLHCSRAGISAYLLHPSPDCQQHFIALSQQFWDIALKTLALNHCHAEAHALVAVLLDHRLVSIKAEFFHLYSQGSNNRVSPHSIRSLLSYLWRHPAPHPRLAVGMPADCPQNWFKAAVVQWIFPPDSLEEEDHPVDNLLQDCQLLAALLSSLCVQDPRTSRSLPLSPVLNTDKWHWMNQLERELLYLTFDSTATLPLDKEASPSGNTSSVLEKTNWKNLQESVCRVSSYLMRPYSNEVDSKLEQVVIQLRVAKLLVRFMAMLIQDGVLTCLSTLSSSSISRQITKLLSFVVVDASIFHSGVPQAQLAQIMALLRELLTLPDSGPSLLRTWLGSILPSDLDNFFLEFLFRSGLDHFLDPNACINEMGDGPNLMQVQGTTPLLQLALDCLSCLSVWSHSAPQADRHDGIKDRLIKDLLKAMSLDSPLGIHLLLALARFCPGCCTSPLDQVALLLELARKLLHQHHALTEVCCLSLALLQTLMPHLEFCHHSEVKQLMKGFWKLRREKNLSSKFDLALLHTTAEIIKHDLDWSDEPELTNQFPKFLTSPHTVIQAISKLEYLFLKGPNLPRPPGAQNQAFQAILEAFANIPSTPMEGEEAMLRDQQMSQTSALLLTLGHILQVSPCCESLTLAALLQAVNDHKASPHLIHKVLTPVCLKLGYQKEDGVVQLLSSHLPFLLEYWYTKRYTLPTFPIVLLHLNDPMDFFRKHYSTIIPLLVGQSMMDAVKKLSEKIGEDYRSLLTECLPRLLAHILPWLSAANTDEGAKRKALHSLQILVEHLTKEALDKSIFDRLEELLLHLMAMVMEDDTRCEPEPNPPFISPALYNSTLEYLTNQACRNKEPRLTLAAILAKKQDGIQKILLALLEKLTLATRTHELFRALQMYQRFLALVSPHLGTRLGESSVFLIETVVHTMANFLSHSSCYPSDISDLAINIASELCRAASSHHAKDIGKLLPIIIKMILPFCHDKRDETSKKCLNLLTFLFSEEAGLDDAIAALHPLPKLPIFVQLHHRQQALHQRHNTSLEKIMSHFLAAPSDAGLEEGLEQLYSVLCSRKEELQDLAQKLRDTTPLESDGIRSSPLHQTVCCLLQLTTFHHKEEASLAAKCLGEIGPIDLCSVVLRPHSSDPKLRWFRDSCPLHLAYCHIFSQLAGLLHEPQFAVVSAASQVLKTCLAMDSVKEFFKVYVAKNIDNLFNFLHPFYNLEPPQQHLSAVPFSLEVLEQEELWAPDRPTAHEAWVTELTCTLLEMDLADEPVFLALTPICRVKASFSEQVLPYLIHHILVAGNPPVIGSISRMVALFFLKHFEAATSSTAVVDGSVVFLHKPSIQVMLAVVHHLRQQPNTLQEGDGVGWSNNWWLDLNYLHVSQAAKFCSAHFTSLLYAELWCYSSLRNSEDPNSASDVSSSEEFAGGHSQVPLVSAVGGLAGVMADLACNAYIQIGDPDGVYAWPQTPGFLEQHLSQERNFHRLLAHHNLDDHTSQILQSALKCGYLQLVSSFIQHESASSAALPPDHLEYQAECLWRLGHWDQPLIVDGSEAPGFQHSVYKCITSLKQFNQHEFSSTLSHARGLVSLSLQDLSLESAHPTYHTLGKLALLNVLEDATSLFFNQRASCKSKWASQSQLPFSDFAFEEPSAWLRCLLLHHGSKLSSPCINTALMESYLVECLEHGHLDGAKHCLKMLRTLQPTSPHWQLSQARLHWMEKDHLMAKQVLNSLLVQLTQNGTTSGQLYSEALTMKGTWLAEQCEESLAAVLRDYLQPAVESQGSDWKPHLAVARCADQNYLGLVEYTCSPGWQTKLANLQASLADAASLKTRISRDQNMDLMRKLHILEKQNEIDQAEIKAKEKDRPHYLMLALRHYLHCVSHAERSSTANLWVFRITSLWFENSSDPQVNQTIQEWLNRVPAHTFLPLLHQLAARMGTSLLDDSTSFHSVLKQLLEKVTLVHPHHALPILLALAFADKDQVKPERNRGETEQERVSAAKKIIADLKKTALKKTILQMEQVFTAYIQLAYSPVNKNLKNATKNIKIPETVGLTKLQDLDLPILTEDIPVDPLGKYQDLPTIKFFSPTYSLCGGLNAPKIITCISNHGRQYTQLVKGQDDLRQDAVMQQVFGLVNQLLLQNKETRRRKLAVRTYKVVPLASRSGVIQWCEGTQPLNEYLIDEAGKPLGAHTRYRPGDWSELRCFKKMAACYTNSKDTRIKAYNTIVQKFHPVLRYFFLEKFPEPPTWFERRLAYTRSVATSSIVGYIMGLGDRHGCNILLDLRSAEVVHIDFGIAFDKGKLLRTPETVPFRLTRDIVDGMGVSGVDGVFRRCCEKTLEVLRQFQDVIRTIVEVLLYDPLYDWSIPVRKQTGQASSSDHSTQGGGEEVNKLAERALLRLKEKLQGLEEGVVLSIPGQVNLLVQHARDPLRLGLMYHGWRPYL